MQIQIANWYTSHVLASFLGLSTIQFFYYLVYKQKQRGKASYHVSVVSGNNLPR